MRTEHLLIVAVLSAVPCAAQAQNPPSQPPAQTQPPAAPAPDVTAPGAFTGHVDFGVRGTTYTADSDRARYQRYRDLRNGVIADALRAGKEGDGWTFTASADHIGYRDQRYVANYDRHGKVKVAFAFDQIPLFYSTDTATPYTSQTKGTLLLPDDTQRAIQNAAANLLAYTTIAPAFDLRHKRSIADARMTYSVTPQIDLNVSFRNTAKNGEQAWSGTFGFSDAVEYAVPI